MLQELMIRDFAIISNLNVRFDDGMTVLTGETGAGKSIVIDALGLLIGGRGSTEFIRHQAKKCQLEGLFTLPKKHPVFEELENLGIETPDEQIIIQRDILANGKNTCRINGHLVNIATLKQIGRYLVDIQGQQDHQLLLQPDYHHVLLDCYAKDQIAKPLAEYQAIFSEYQQLAKELKDRKHNEKEFAQRMDMLQFQIQEIEAANLEEGEEERLREELNRLQHVRRIGEQLQLSYEALTDEMQGGERALNVAMSAMNDIANLAGEYQQMAELLTNAYYTVTEVISDIDSAMDNLDVDEGRQDFVENRLMEIHGLERKYGEDIPAILRYYDDIVEEYTHATSYGDSVEELQQQVDRLEEQLQKQADKLSSIRHQASKQLAKDIAEQLKELYMEQAEFEVRFTETPLMRDGKEEVEFYITTNKGEEMKPLVKIVSGGELSRIILALKTIFTESRGITSIVFDEVDTGVSGRVAQAIAEKIYQIGEHSQVLCISHLPQVAAFANHQYYIRKDVEDGRTEMHLTLLNDGERIDEIARMLSGTEVTELTREHAKELLDMVSKEKQKISTKD